MRTLAPTPDRGEGLDVGRAFRTINAVRDAHAITGAPRAVLWALAGRADGVTGRNARPSQETIALESGRDDRTVRRALKWLEADGYIRRTGTYPAPRGSGRPIIVWALDLDALDRAAPDAGLLARTGHRDRFEDAPNRSESPAQPVTVTDDLPLTSPKSNSRPARPVQSPLVGVVAPAAASQDDEQTGPSTADVAQVVGLLAAVVEGLDRTTAADVRAALASSGLSPVALVDLVTRETRAKARSNPAGYARTVLRLVARGDFTSTRPVVDTPTPTPRPVAEVLHEPGHEPADPTTRAQHLAETQRLAEEGRRKVKTTRTAAAS